MIRTAAVTVLVVAALCLGAEAQDTDKYSSRYDHIDLDNILSNDRLFKRYFQCLLEEEDTQCTPDGKMLKKVIPETLTTNCSKCSEKQYERTHKILKHLIVHRPVEWAKLGAKYDPNREHMPRFEKLYGNSQAETSTETASPAVLATGAEPETAMDPAAAMEADLPAVAAEGSS